MTKDQIQSFIADYLSKQAEEGAAHEAGETPNAEMLEHAMGVGGEEPPHGDGPGGVDVEQLLAQLSPEELQALIAELSQGGQPGEGAPGAGGEDVAGLSQGIEEHLAQNPEAQVPGAPPEKMAALNFVKSAHYIEGFIKQAMDYGLDVNQAVGMYDNALTTTVDAMKKEAGQLTVKAPSFTMHGEPLKSRMGRAATDMKRTVQKAYMKNKGTVKAVGGALAAGGAAGAAAGYAAGKSSDDEKKAAYFEGVFKQAASYGISEDVVCEVVKEAASFRPSKIRRPGVKVPINKTAPPVGAAVRNVSKVKRPETAPSPMDNLKAFGSKHKDKAVGAAAGLAVGGAAGYASKSSDKEKKAAYIEGVFKQAMAYGFSESEAVQFAQQAEANL